MNKLRQTFESALVTYDQYQRENAAKQAAREFSQRFKYLMTEADDQPAVRQTALYWEARATRSYVASDPFSKFGITQKRRSDAFLERAQRATGWSEDMALRHKQTRDSYDQIMGYTDASQSSMLPSDIEAFREIAS